PVDPQSSMQLRSPLTIRAFGALIIALNAKRMLLAAVTLRPPRGLQEVTLWLRIRRKQLPRSTTRPWSAGKRRTSLSSSSFRRAEARVSDVLGVRSRRQLEKAGAP